MDSVIVFFRNATYEQVEEAALPFGFVRGTVSRGTAHFFLWRYMDQEQEAELSEDERVKLHGVLGGKPSSAFQVASRHGENARLALEATCHLMSRFEPCVLDDDFGHLWSPHDVSACFESRAKEGIYALRDRTNISFQPTAYGGG